MRLNKVLWTAGLAAGVFAFTVFAWAGEDKEQQLARQDVPAAVLTAFEKAYPKADIKGFTKEEKDGKTVYEVESMEGKIHRDVTFLEDGTLYTVEEVVAAKSLPESVRQTLKKEHPKGKIKLAEVITTGTLVEYEVLVVQGAKSLEIKLDKDGKVVSVEESKPSD